MKKKLFEPSPKYMLDYKAALEFHETMCMMRKWLNQQLKEKHSEDRVKQWTKEHENQHKLKQPKPTPINTNNNNAKSMSRMEFDLIANNLLADSSHLSSEELAIFRLTDVHYDRETNKMKLNFTLPSRFRYKPYVDEFMNQTMDKIESIWASALAEIKNTEGYKSRVRNTKKFQEANK